MLGIKRESDYAVRTVLHLAALGRGVTIQVRDVARQRRLPLSFVRRIVARLRSRGIVATTRGMGGGIALARPAAEISLLDVLEAMDDGVSLNRCLDASHTCPLSDGCPAQSAWADATSVLEGHLAAVRFDALSERDARHGVAHRDLVTGPEAVPGEGPALPSLPALPPPPAAGRAAGREAGAPAPRGKRARRAASPSRKRSPPATRGDRR